MWQKIIAKQLIPVMSVIRLAIMLCGDVRQKWGAQKFASVCKALCAYGGRSLWLDERVTYLCRARMITILHLNACAINLKRVNAVMAI